MKIFHPTKGTRDIPSVDFTQAWRDRGWSNVPLDGSPELIEPTLGNTPDALTIINTAADVEALKPLPGIGAGAAKVLLEERPDDGYESLKSLPEQLYAHPYNLDVEDLAAYIKP